MQKLTHKEELRMAELKTKALNKYMEGFLFVDDYLNINDAKEYDELWVRWRETRE